jgi:hypothetical protein
MTPTRPETTDALYVAHQKRGVVVSDNLGYLVESVRLLHGPGQVNTRNPVCKIAELDDETTLTAE